MKKSIVVVSVMLSLSLLWGCGAEQNIENVTEPTKTRQELMQTNRAQHYGLSYIPEAGFNPYECTQLLNRPVISAMYQGLFIVTSQYRAEPVLCKTYTMSPNLMEYRFQLEPATFSDGTTLQAEDVVASLQAAKGSKVYGDRLRHVTSIRAQSSTEVAITLDTPYENLPVLLDIPVVKAAEVKETHPLGTGPYSLSDSNGSLSLVRRSQWWSEYAPAVSFDQIPLSVAVTPSDVRDHFEFGTTDLVCADPGSPSYVKYRCDYELWDCATGIMLYLGCNNGGSSPFSNGEIRAALTNGVDRKALVEVYGGFAQAACLPASPESDVYDSTLAASFDYNPEAFSQALQNAGMYGTSARLLVCSDNPKRVQAAQTIAKQLTDSGLTVEVNAKSWDGYMEALKVGNFDFYLGEVRLSPNFDLSPFFDANGALNYGGMTDAEQYALCLKALENSGNYYDLHSAVMEDGQLCPLMFRTYAVYVTRGSMTGLLPGLDNVFHTANSRQLTQAKTEWPEPPAPTEETKPTEETDSTQEPDDTEEEETEEAVFIEETEETEETEES